MVIYIYHLRDDPPEMRSASRLHKQKYPGIKRKNPKAAKIAALLML
jgi:hypothetical protein